MNQYLFFLGQNHPLSLAELNSRLPADFLDKSINDKAYVKLDIDPLAVANDLGGTIKISKKLADISDQLEEQLSAILLDLKASTYSITLLGSFPITQSSLNAKVKETLTKSLPKVRYVLPKSDGLSPLILSRQHVIELIVDADSQAIYQTIWVHDFDGWIKRDRQKPYVTPRLGMLPPKLARIMVNLGLQTREKDSVTLLDPFCGSGTILSEAHLIGLSVIGSDLSQDQVDGTRKNLDWLNQQYEELKQHQISLFIADATHVSQKLNTKVDLIVTEPSLGPTTPPLAKQLNIAKGLYKLYLGALKDWQKVVNTNHTIVFAYPLFEDPKTLKYFHAFIDTCLKFGYNQRQQNLIFTRPSGKIQRQIIILDK